jgi:hypothetical protein
MPSPKSQRFGPVVARRHRDGTCTAACNRRGCRAYAEPHGWRRTVRLAREHAAAHAHTDARYVDTPWGVPAHELPRATKPRRRLAAVAAVLLLAVLAFGVTVVSVAGRAGSAPAPVTVVSVAGRAGSAPAPTTTTTTTPAPGEYIPVPAGPPSSSPAGGDR